MVGQVRNLVASRDQHLKRLYENIKALNAELNSLKELMGQQAPPGVTGDLDPAVAMFERRIQALEAHLAQLKNSTSWRITRPMRQLKRRLTGG